MKELILVAGALAALLSFTSGANAHALLDRAAPAAGSTVQGSPPSIKLWFTQPLEPAFSTVRVLDRTGKRVDNGDKGVGGADRTILRISLPRLPPGTYRVVWRVVSADAHVTEGDFTFDVAP
jgi:methionine-rich copper-binding protein CopC